MADATSTLQLNIAQGAAQVDLQGNSLRPADAALAYGKPGEQVLVTVSSGAGIVENEYRGYWQFPLLQDGFGRFSVAMPVDPQGPKGASLVTANYVSEPANRVDGVATFAPYRIGKGHIHAYSYTTGAPADGESSCSVYVMVDRAMDIGSITSIVARVDGNAFIQNDPTFPQLAHILLDAQGNVTINIADKTAEMVNVTLALPESPDGEFVRFRVGFLVFPDL